MARRRRPLRAVSLVFAGFVTLVLLSQLSAHFFAAAIPRNLLTQNEAVLSNIQQTSTGLAIAASALALIFAGAVLIITKETVSSDVDVYRATGLPPFSAFLRLVGSHSILPLGLVTGATAVVALVDVAFGLDALLPVGLAISFVVLVVGWLGFLTSVSFSQRTVDERLRGRAG